MSRCFCGLVRPESGPCLHGGPPEASRRHLQQQAKKRKANDRQSRQRTGYLNITEVRDAAARAVPAEARSRAFWTRSPGAKRARRTGGRP